METPLESGNEQIAHALKLPNRKYGYFRDDQFICRVTQSNDLVSNTQLKDFWGVINGALGELNGGKIVDTPQAISFPKFTSEEIKQSTDLPSGDETSTSAFSIIKCEVQGTPENPAGLLDVIRGLTNQLRERSLGALTIKDVTPNWLTSVTSQGSGTGGPGGRPSPYYGSRKNAPYGFDIVTQLKDKNIYGDGTGVDVAILDTAPSAHDLVAAHKEWPDHPIIASLLGPGGKLHLYPASYDELLHMGSLSLNDHDYKMTDHGLFIAGIIHSIVPNAEIHLIEVLNHYGIGDFANFVQGLQKVRSEIYKPDRKMVINCSWMLEFPRDDHHCRHMNQTGDPDAYFEWAVREFSKTDQATLLTLETLFNQFYYLNRQAIAAAGNDGRKEHPERVEARYPAALKRVTGVGALPKSLERGGNGKFLPSVFSNLADTPEKKGIATLGGEEGEGKGVLGLYIGEFPDCCRNESKWAWWAGTSFAAPILTGTVASILSRTANNITSTQAAIAKLYGTGAKIILDGQADRQQDALPVTQC
jgi:Subtilase family